jgi:pimeloyl-ACP methyl ester carboxylesterase
MNMSKQLLKLSAVMAISLLNTLTISAQQNTLAQPADLADPNGAFVELDGVRIYYITEGDPQNPPVVLIHGLNGSTVNWRSTVPALADAGFYTIAVDLPPFGLSDKDTSLNYTHKQMAAWVIGLMDELGIESASVIGHSMGGLVTTYVATDYPQRVDKLGFVSGGLFSLIEDAGFDLSGANPLSEALANVDPDSPLINAILRRLLNRNFAESSLRAAVYDESIITPELIDANARPVQVEGATAGFLAFARTEQSEAPTIEELAQVAADMPTFVAWGAQDQVVPVRLGQLMRDNLPDVTYVTYERVGHLPMDEVPDMFNADLIAFLRSD